MLCSWGPKGSVKKYGMAAKAALLLVGMALTILSFLDFKYWIWLLPVGAYLVNLAIYISVGSYGDLSHVIAKHKARVALIVASVVALSAIFIYYVYANIYLDGRFTWHEKAILLCLWMTTWFFDAVVERKETAAS
jgi:hypothetical protein